MPYIKNADRHQYDYTVDALAVFLKDKPPGEFNYAVTRLVLKILDDHGMSYTKINELIGALECLKLELYRRQAAPYEDVKAEENGEVL